MFKQYVVCIVPTENQAVLIINELHKAGFLAEDISLLLSDKTANDNFVYEKHSKAPEGVVRGAIVGAIWGGLLGWIAAEGEISFLAFSFFLINGPVIWVLTGVAFGAVIGGLIGALIGSKTPKYEVRQYAGHIKQGNVLISVSTKNQKKRDFVKNLFQSFKTKNIAITHQMQF